MSHTYVHEETGVRFHFNGDHSGDTTILLPDGSEFQVPGAALVAFGRNAPYGVECDWCEHDISAHGAGGCGKCSCVLPHGGH